MKRHLPRKETSNKKQKISELQCKIDSLNRELEELFISLTKDERLLYILDFCNHHNIYAIKSDTMSDLYSEPSYTYCIDDMKNHRNTLVNLLELSGFHYKEFTDYIDLIIPIECFDEFRDFVRKRARNMYEEILGLRVDMICKNLFKIYNMDLVPKEEIIRAFKPNHIKITQFIQIID